MATHFSRISIIAKSLDKEHLDRALLDLHGVRPDSIAAGRNVTAGYTRGWGLEYGGLADAIRQDPIFSESLALARGRTLLSEHKLMNLYLIMRYGSVTGDILEFGSYRGGGAIFLANLARRLGKTLTIYALDTFEGMPETHDVLDLHFAGNFSDTSYEELAAYVEQIGLTNMVLAKGRFEDTVPGLLESIGAIGLAHIDCDIYAGVAYCLKSVMPKMQVDSGYIVLDDPLHGSCLGALQAVEDWVVIQDLRAEQAYPHLVYRYPRIC